MVVVVESMVKCEVVVVVVGVVDGGEECHSY